MKSLTFADVCLEAADNFFAERSHALVHLLGGIRISGEHQAFLDERRQAGDQLAVDHGERPAGLALVPFFGLNDFYLQILFTIGVNYLAAAGLNVLVGYAGQKSLGHAGLFAVGAYTAAIANIEWGLNPWLSLLSLLLQLLLLLFT